MAMQPWSPFAPSSAVLSFEQLSERLTPPPVHRPSVLLAETAADVLPMLLAAAQQGSDDGDLDSVQQQAVVELAKAVENGEIDEAAAEELARKAGKEGAEALCAYFGAGALSALCGLLGEQLGGAIYGPAKEAAGWMVDQATEGLGLDDLGLGEGGGLGGGFGDGGSFGGSVSVGSGGVDVSVDVGVSPTEVDGVPVRDSQGNVTDAFFCKVAGWGCKPAAPPAPAPAVPEAPLLRDYDNDRRRWLADYVGWALSNWGANPPADVVDTISLQFTGLSGYCRYLERDGKDELYLPCRERITLAARNMAREILNDPSNRDPVYAYKAISERMMALSYLVLETLGGDTIRQRIRNLLLVSTPPDDFVKASVASQLIFAAVAAYVNPLCPDQACRDKAKAAAFLFLANARARLALESMTPTLAQEVADQFLDNTLKVVMERMAPAKAKEAAGVLAGTSKGPSPEAVEKALGERLAQECDAGDAGCLERATEEARETVAAGAASGGGTSAGGGTSEEKEEGRSPLFWVGVVGLGALGVWTVSRVAAGKPILPGGDAAEGG